MPYYWNESEHLEVGDPMTAPVTSYTKVDYKREPLAIDLFCGLGGWTEGLLSEGYRVVGFDIERHAYGDAKYPAQLVIQDVLTIHGSQFKDAALIVASPPCQEYSYMAMPWSRAKQIEREYLDGTRDRAKLTALFDACFRIQREAIEAAGHHIPLVVENVRGAQKWVGRSRWNFGSFHLWGDVPALMPMVKRHVKAPGHSLNKGAAIFRPANALGFERPEPLLLEGTKQPGISGPRANFKGDAWFQDGGAKSGHRRISEAHRSKSPAKGYGAVTEDGIKQGGIGGPRLNGKGDAWFQDGAAKHGSKSPARKAASAMIAKIPLVLSQHISRVYHPERAV